MKSGSRPRTSPACANSTRSNRALKSPAFSGSTGSPIAFSQTLGTPLRDWAAFILTRLPGATIDDFLDKPINQCGLDLGRDAATAVSIAAIRLALIAIPQGAARTAH
jgi:hypothetical protein